MTPTTPPPAMGAEAKMPEPVAWRYMHEGQPVGIHPRQIHRYYSFDGGQTFVEGEPLYTAAQLQEAARQALKMAYDAMFDAKGCKACRFDAQSAIRALIDQPEKRHG